MSSCSEGDTGQMLGGVITVFAILVLFEARWLERKVREAAAPALHCPHHLARSRMSLHSPGSMSPCTPPIKLHV